MSLFTSSLIFMLNFSLFMVYFYVAMLGGAIAASFQLPLIMQFIILFFYSNRLLTLQINIRSMDKFSDLLEQREWASNYQIRVYLFSFVLTIFIEKLYLSNFLVMALMGCLWLPQIYLNTIKGYRRTPSMYYAVCVTLHTVLVPVYVKLIPGNFLALRPQFIFGTFLVLFLSVQLIILGI
jgi:hypothetical protein